MIADVGLAAIPTVSLDVLVPGATAQSLPGLFLTQKVFGQMAVGVQTHNQRFQDGAVHLSGLPPGQMELNVISQNGGATAQQTVNVSGNSSVQIKPGPASAISGTVSLGGRPVSQGVVLLTNHAGISEAAKISAKGEFQLTGVSFKPGTYEVAAFDVPDSGIGTIAAIGATVRGRNLEIDGTGPVQLNIVMSKGLGRIDGTALRDGKPMGGAMIVLVPQDLEHNRMLIRRDQSDSDGTFTLPQILPGQYSILALQNGWEMEWQNPSVLAPYLKTAQTVDVSQNQRYQVKVNVQ